MPVSMVMRAPFGVRIMYFVLCSVSLKKSVICVSRCLSSAHPGAEKPRGLETLWFIVLP